MENLKQIIFEMGRFCCTSRYVIINVVVKSYDCPQKGKIMKPKTNTVLINMKNIRTGERKTSLNKNGITLVSLVITIIILLILASVAISLAIDSDGLFARARKAAEDWNTSVAREQEAIENTWLILNEIKMGDETKEEGTITEDNYKDYLGKVVTNIRPEGTGDTEAVGEYTVGTKYRLYYVDFGNKYGDGVGTIYLKADCTSNNYTLPITDTTDVDSTKMKQLNPELYKTTPPDEGNENMKAVKWLLNPANWESLKENSPIKDSINYVVGAPSLEMMMDSYNDYYDLKGITSPQTGSIQVGERRRLFYRYTSGNTGYEVGPESNNEWSKYCTSGYSVQTDSEIDEMYYPGSGHYYWLASPSAERSNYLMFVYCNDGGYVNRYKYDSINAFCPIVSLKSSVQLEFEE